MSAAANDPVLTSQQVLDARRIRRAAVRRAFDAAIWRYYSELKAKGWSAPEEGDFTPEALLWRTDTGLYGVTQIQAAWVGWLLACDACDAGHDLWESAV